MLIQNCILQSWHISIGKYKQTILKKYVHKAGLLREIFLLPFGGSYTFPGIKISISEQ